jgi:Major tropism determinant N-terminal domain
MSVQVQLRRDTYANIMAATVPGAAGEVYVDTTNQRLVVNNGSLIGGFPAPVTLAVKNSTTDTNNSSSGSGSYFSHATTFTIPTNFMIAARAFRLTGHFQLTTGSSPPTISFRLSLGATVIYVSGFSTPGASLTNVQLGVQWIFQATQAPGASSNVQCTAINQANGVGSAAVGLTAMPVAVATNAAQALTIATDWATAGVGTNTIALNQFILEALN